MRAPVRCPNRKSSLFTGQDTRFPIIKQTTASTAGLGRSALPALAADFAGRVEKCLAIVWQIVPFHPPISGVITESGKHANPTKKPRYH
jgi:hypothetical protein